MINIRKIHCIGLGFILATSVSSKAMEIGKETFFEGDSSAINYENVSTYELIKKFSWQDVTARQILAEKIFDGTLIIEYYQNTFNKVAPKLLKEFHNEKMTNLSDEELFLFVSLSKDDDVYKSVIPITQSRIDQGSIKARLILAHLYETGKGVEKNLQKVLELYESVDSLAHGVALTNLGLLYQYNSDPSMTKNPIKAENCLRKSADLGNIRGKMELAEFLFKRDGASLQSTEIFSLYTEAALAGIDYANHALGTLYFHLGQLEEGTKWFLNLKVSYGGLRGKVNFWFISQRHKVVLFYSLYDKEGSKVALDQLKHYMKEPSIILPEKIQNQEESINNLVQDLMDLESDYIFLEARSGGTFNEKLFGENNLLVEKSREINKLLSSYKHLGLSLLEPGTLVTCLDVEKYGHCDEGTIYKNMKVIYDDFTGDKLKYIMLNALRNKRLQKEINLNLLDNQELTQKLTHLLEIFNFFGKAVSNLMSHLESSQVPFLLECSLKENMKLNLPKSDTFDQKIALESLGSYFNKFPYEDEVQSQLLYLVEVTKDIGRWESKLTGDIEFSCTINEQIRGLIKDTVDLRNSILYEKLNYTQTD